MTRLNMHLIPLELRLRPQWVVWKYVERPGNDNLAVEAHITNWLDAIRGKAKLIAPVQVGQQAAISGHMATLSFRNNKKVLWDEKTNKYRFA